jgi:hypothetical protein
VVAEVICLRRTHAAAPQNVGCIRQDIDPQLPRSKKSFARRARFCGDSAR